MTATDATGSTLQPFAPARVVRFIGESRVFWRLLARGAVLLMFTLGIYRFWLTTDIRRFLWSNTAVADETFEYTGTARELLLGFLIAIAVLLPLYSGFFLLTLALGQGWSLASILVLTFLGHYAVFRARRYRLTRTIYRGVRFHQTGSAWRYAVCALLWWTLIILSLGLAYPFAQAQLERFKMRNTFFGDLPGRFEGSGMRLLLRGFVLWLVAVVPFTIGAAASLLAVNWSGVRAIGSGDDVTNWLETSGFAAATVFAGLTGVWLLVSFAILYPIFQAIVLRWWASGLRFGEVAVTSRLRTGHVFAVYGRFVGYALLFTLLAGSIVAAGAFVLHTIAGQTDSLRDEIITTMAGIGSYVAIALGYSTIYQATFKLGLWRCVAESLEMSNLEKLEQVAGAGEPASPVGEGLADALNVGGM
jgi:uncharacterized membrane protein YjgN (DUF898 family)